MFNETESHSDDFSPLTAEQAQDLRKRQPVLSVWRVVGVQLLVALVVSALAFWLVGEAKALSVLYGGLAVVLPSALFARGMTSKLTSSSLGAAVAGFLVWELVKIASTLVMLYMANVWITGVSWPAMLVGFVLTMKVNWVMLGFGRIFYPKIKFN